MYLIQFYSRYEGPGPKSSMPLDFMAIPIILPALRPYLMKVVFMTNHSILHWCDMSHVGPGGTYLEYEVAAFPLNDGSANHIWHN